MAQRRDGQETRDHLLAAALEVFIERGYRDATVAEICRRAGVNGAAVNYHFQGKDHLYAEAWKLAFAEADRKAPIDDRLADSAPPSERLHALIAGVFNRILRHGAQSRSGRLLLQEIAQPTPALEPVRHEATAPVRQRLQKTVRDFLGPRASEQQVVHCCMSIMHQILAIGFRGGHKPPSLGGGNFTDDEIDALIEHTYHFSLGGLQAVASRPHLHQASKQCGA